MIYFVVDPGEVCGYIVFDAIGTVHEFGETDPYSCVSAGERFAVGGTTFVVERYVITPQTAKMTRQYAALETIGALRYVATKTGSRFILQSRSQKNRISNDALKRAGLWMPTKGGHANDAARHGIITFIRELPNSPIVKLALGTID